MTGSWSCMSVVSCRTRTVYWLCCPESLNSSLSQTHNNRVPELQLLSCSVVVHSAVIVFYFHTDQEPDSINSPQVMTVTPKQNQQEAVISITYVCKKWPMSTVKGNLGNYATPCGITWWLVLVGFIIAFMNSVMQHFSSCIIVCHMLETGGLQWYDNTPY